MIMIAILATFPCQIRPLKKVTRKHISEMWINTSSVIDYKVLTI